MSLFVDFLMSFLLFVMAVAMIYAIFFLFPKKLKLIKKFGGHLTNDDFIKMAKNGNEEAKGLVVKTKYTAVVMVICGIALVMLKHVYKG